MICSNITFYQYATILYVICEDIVLINIFNNIYEIDFDDSRPQVRSRTRRTQSSRWRSLWRAGTRSCRPRRPPRPGGLFPFVPCLNCFRSRFGVLEKISALSKTARPPARTRTRRWAAMTSLARRRSLPGQEKQTRKRSHDTHLFILLECISFRSF